MPFECSVLFIYFNEHRVNILLKKTYNTFDYVKIQFWRLHTKLDGQIHNAFSGIAESLRKDGRVGHPIIELHYITHSLY